MAPDALTSKQMTDARAAFSAWWINQHIWPDIASVEDVVLRAYVAGWNRAGAPDETTAERQRDFELARQAAELILGDGSMRIGSERWQVALRTLANFALFGPNNEGWPQHPKASASNETPWQCTYPGCGAEDGSKCRHWPRSSEKTSRELAPSEAASLDKALSRSPRRVESALESTSPHPLDADAREPGHCRQCGHALPDKPV